MVWLWNVPLRRMPWKFDPQLMALFCKAVEFLKTKALLFCHLLSIQLPPSPWRWSWAFAAGPRSTLATCGTTLGPMGRFSRFLMQNASTLSLPGQILSRQTGLFSTDESTQKGQSQKFQKKITQRAVSFNRHHRSIPSWNNGQEKSETRR